MKFLGLASKERLSKGEAFSGYQKEEGESHYATSQLESFSAREVNIYSYMFPSFLSSLNFQFFNQTMGQYT